MDDELVQVKMSGAVAFERGVSLQQAVKILGFLVSGNPLPNDLQSEPDVRSGGDENHNGNLSPREVLSSTGAGTNAEKIAAFAYYLSINGKDRFTQEDIKELFGRAKESMPKNFSRDFGGAIKSGWIEERSGGECYLTISGEEAVASKFQGDKASVRTRSKPRSKTKGSSKSSSGGRKGSEDSLSRLRDIGELSAELEGFPEYHDMETNPDRILWVLEWGKTRDLPNLTYQEIARLTDRLGVGVPSRQISSAFQSAQKNGFATRSTVDDSIRIVPKGTQYLRSKLEKS